MKTLHEVAQAADIGPRSIQLWAEAGALKVGFLHKGRGRPRTFSDEEAEIARVLAVFSKQGVPIGTLTGIANSLRPFSKQKLRAWWRSTSTGIERDLLG